MSFKLKYTHGKKSDVTAFPFKNNENPSPNKSWWSDVKETYSVNRDKGGNWWQSSIAAVRGDEITETDDHAAERRRSQLADRSSIEARDEEIKRNNREQKAQVLSNPVAPNDSTETVRRATNALNV